MTRLSFILHVLRQIIHDDQGNKCCCCVRRRRPLVSINEETKIHFEKNLFLNIRNKNFFLLDKTR